MAKRYTFWRMPDGRPYKRDDDRHAPTALLAKIGESASLPATGGISWPFTELHRYELAVLSSIAVTDENGDELNDTDASSVVWDAIKSEITKHGGGKAILPKSLLQTGDRIASALVRKPSKEYVLLTSLSIESLPAKIIQINECQFSALKGRGRKYPFPDGLETRSYDEQFSTHLNATKYLPIRVKTHGRTAYEAASRALDATNLLRGLWTIPATYGSWTFRIGSARPEPIGVIHNGPIHTLHNVDGSPATDIFWYEPDYTGERKLFKPKAGWKALDKQRRWALRQLRQLPHRSDVERLIIRFAVALDQPNLDVAFVHMWSILEHLTNTVGANYDETIDRATWVFPDRKIARELLSHLRLRRNRFVHAAKSGEKSDEVAYMVKSFVEPHLVRLLRNDFKVSSVEEYGTFLSLPTNLDTLKKRRDALNLAILLRKE